MEANTMETTILQWHPAFFAGMQVELQWERKRLFFENEHQLGTKPKEIDVLIIKKDPNIPIKKNIGQIFKTHNIVEFKGPEDYLCIDDYYKVYYQLRGEYFLTRSSLITPLQFSPKAKSYVFPSASTWHSISKGRSSA